MPQPSLTPLAKNALRRTVGDLRTRLLEDFRAAADSAYLLSVSAIAARLSEAAGIRRRRLEGWLDEQARSVPEAEREKKPAELRERFLGQAVKEAASTLLNRLILIAHHGGPVRGAAAGRAARRARRGDQGLAEPCLPGVPRVRPRALQ